MKKKFDAVKFQRKIREELSKKYNDNCNDFFKELKSKYGSLKPNMKNNANEYDRRIVKRA